MIRSLFALLLVTTLTAAAQASGVDIAFDACPGDSASRLEATLDCAAGRTLVLHLTFAPAESIADLGALDTVLEFRVTGGDVGSTTNFWDSATFNRDAFAISFRRPRTNCSGWRDTWAQASAGSALVSLVQNSNVVRTAAMCWRPGPIAVGANERLYGLQIAIDASNSLEAGGTAAGCAFPVRIRVEKATPQSVGNAPTTELHEPTAGHANCVHLNRDLTTCGAAIQPRRGWDAIRMLLD